MKTVCEEELLNEMGVEFAKLETGCCGMAGAFGFEQEHYDVSIACGERVLLPEVRKDFERHIDHRRRIQLPRTSAPNNGSYAVHIAEVLKMAIDEGPRGPAGNFPEKNYITPEPLIPSKARTLTLLAVGAFVGGALGGIFFSRQRRR